jgi:catechol 2,3-dioxygenase-like lactoylglutathione lyase family enzyme
MNLRMERLITPGLHGGRLPRLLALGLVSIGAFAAEPQRPPITGIANIAVKVSNLEAARNFYGHVLGYQEAFTLKQASGADLICYKVNDRQYVEIAQELKNPNEDRLIHIAFETSDAAKLRAYLAAKGVEVPTGKLTPDAGGNLSVTVQDPDGHLVEFVQYTSKSLQHRNLGKFLPDTRVSDHILHVGIHVADRAKSDAFYVGILGFRLLWEGGPANNPSAWISYLVPDGKDWVEYMMSTALPNPKQLGGMHHYALEVMDIQKPYQTVMERGYTQAAKPVLARDGRWLDNFYDPDFTRTEMMIRKPAQTPCCTPLHDPYIEQ